MSKYDHSLQPQKRYAHVKSVQKHKTAMQRQGGSHSPSVFEILTLGT